MSEIKEGFFPYKEFRYDANQDAYELMSRWTSADTVFLGDGTNVSDALTGIVSDSSVSENSTWSSSKVSSELNTLSNSIDKKSSLYCAALYKDGEDGDTWEIPIFEGIFSLSRNTHCILGIVDRWGNITYIKEEESTFAKAEIITSGSQQKLRLKNNSSYSILAMFMPAVRYFS